MMNAFMDFFSGSLGGAAGVLVGHPFDTVKARLQTQSSEAVVGSQHYKGTLDCFRKIIQQESIFGLYKGVSSPLAGLTLINAIVFGAYGNTIKCFQDQTSIRSHVIAGALAGTAQSIVCSPMEMSKLWIQLQGQGIRHYFFWNPAPGNLYSSPMDALRKIRQRYGIRGCYRGLSLTIARDATGFAMYFAAYEALTRWIVQNFGREPNAPELLLAGGLAGMFSWFLNYPIDVVKTRYQADLMDQQQLYKNIRHCCEYSYQKEGWRCFFQGLTPTLIRAFPTNAVTFFTVAMVYRLYRHLSAPDPSASASIPLEAQISAKKRSAPTIRVHFVEPEEFIILH